MAIVEISKRRVIEVLTRENLKHGTYGDDPKGSTDSKVLASTRGCSFCAVGAVVRGAMWSKATVGQVARAASCQGIGGSPELRQMEGAFEGWDVGGEGGRKAVVAWARKNLPASIRIDIGNAKPRRGMKVVG